MTTSDNTTPEERQRLLDEYMELAQLSGSLAHEIKNPLAVIGMNMDLLAEDFEGGESPAERRALSKIRLVQDQCVRLESLLNDFLRFARVRSLQLNPGNLNTEVERVLDLFEPQARETEIEIVRYLEPDLASVVMDPETLQAALLNLVKNAFEAMPGGGELMVRTYLTPSGAALDLIDSGCGMDQRTALNMFEAFFTTKQGGSGLGLPTARKIIEAHGGRIHVQSASGRGTKFTLEFPLPPRITGERETGEKEAAESHN